MSSPNLDFTLIPWQEKVWMDPSRFKVIVAGRRSGKTRFAAYKMVVERMNSDRGDIIYVAPTMGQAQDLMWDLLFEISGDLIKAWNVNKLEITYINGKKIKLRGADRPETMRGLSIKFVVLDEYADMKKDVWDTIIRPALSDLKGEGVFIGTPMGRNHFYTLYNEAEHGKKGYSSYHFTSYDNPYIDPDEIKDAKEELSSYAFKQEYEASFQARGSEYFKEEWIKYGDEPEEGQYYLACDLAGFKEAGKKSTRNLDNSSLCVVKVNQTGWFVEHIEVGRWELNETALKLFKLVEKYKPVSVGIEKGIARQAVMTPLHDLMKRTGKFFNVVELTHGNQKKTDRIMWALEGRFENGWITLNKGDWNMKFLDELFQFPDPLTHDDTVDSLAYIDQLAKHTAYNFEWAEDEDEFEPVDAIAGY